MKKTSLKLATLALLPASAWGAITPISVSGWTHDLVINGPGPYNTSITNSMDNEVGIENWTWVEAGDYPDPGGTVTTLPGLVAGTHTSVGPSGAQFTFQDFSALNSLRLSAGQSSTLTLDSAAPYSSLVLIGAAANGGQAEVTVTLNFSDLTTAQFTSSAGISRDWFDAASPESAYIAGGRASNRSEDGYSRIFQQVNGAIRLHEYWIELDPADQAKTLTSITIENTGGDGRIAVFAVSGEAVPEPSVLGLAAVCGLMGLGRRRR